MSTLHQTAFTLAQKSYQIGLRFTHKDGEFGVIFVMERSCAALIYKVERHVSNRCSYYTEWIIVVASRAIQYSVNTASHTLTLTSHLGQNVSLGEVSVDSFPET